jgi:glycylpeptide N-tetradecanoyltransferase
MPRPNILSSYVVTDGPNVVGLVSFYHLPSTILKSDTHKELRAAYSYYLVPGKYNLKETFEAALILAKNEGFDVYNALDIMDNKSVFEDLLFKPGDGFLQYYMYNWKLHGTHLQPGQIGKVLF